MNNNIIAYIKHIKFKFIQNNNFRSKSKIFVRTLNKIISKIQNRFVVFDSLLFTNE